MAKELKTFRLDVENLNFLQTLKEKIVIITSYKEAKTLYRQPPHVVQSRYGIVGLAVGNGGFYVKTDQPTTNYRPLPKTIP